MKSDAVQVNAAKSSTVRAVFFSLVFSYRSFMLAYMCLYYCVTWPKVV